MNRPRLLSALVVAIFAASTIWSTGPVARAEPLPLGQMVVVVADGDALRESEHGPDLTRSLVGLIATLQNDRLLAFIIDDQPEDALGPVRASAPELRLMQDEIEARLASSDSLEGGALDDALIEAHSLLGEYRAAAGSTLYVITGESAAAEFQRLAGRGSLLGDMYAGSGWVVNGLTLAGAPLEAEEFLEGLSSATGGWVAELSVDDGFKQMADSLLSQGAKGSLNAVAHRRLHRRELMSEVVSIVPGTRETTLILFRESPYGSVRLSNPSGLEVSAGDRTSSYVVEAPNVVIWKLIDPAPGNWMIEARQTDGLITAWEYSSNGYTLVLQSSAPVPLERAAALSAFVRVDGRKVVVDGVRLFVTITGPEGVSWVQEMRDDGAQGDAVAGDGYFATLLPPLSSEGDYSVELELRWLDYDHRISSRAAFAAKAYPSLEVRPVLVAGVELDERTKVAEVSVHVQGQPYPVAAEQLTALWNSSSDQEAIIELEPRRLSGDGPAWEYDVYLTANESGHHSVLFNLSVDYAGGPYSYSSESMALSTVPAPQPPEPVVLSSVPLEPVAPPPAAELAVPPQPVLVEASGFPLWVLALVVIPLAVIAAGAVYLLTRTRPYGYLYDDHHEPLVDFSKVKRHPILELIFRGSVRGRDLNVPGLEDVVFNFTRGMVKIRSLRQQPTIRVNSQPLVGQAPLEHRTWLGTRGKLYTFMVSASPLYEGAGGD